MKPKLFTHILLVCLLLVGAQALQHAHLHEHDGGLQHLVDCSLFHSQGNDHVLPETTGSSPFAVFRPVFHAAEETFTTSRTSSPYHGRAPPALLSDIT